MTASAIDGGIEGVLASGTEAAGGRDVASSSGAAGAEAGAEVGREEDYKGGCNGMVVLPLTTAAATATVGRWRWRLIVLQWALVATYCNHGGRGSCSC